MRNLTTLLLPLVLTGCGVFGGSNLEGGWSGELECGEAGDFEIEITLEKDDDKDDLYVGTGEIKDIFCSNGETVVECDLLFDVEVEAEGGSGEQDLDIELDNCELEIGGDSTDTDCDDDPEDAEWDGEDTIIFETEVGGVTCDGEIERD